MLREVETLEAGRHGGSASTGGFSGWAESAEVEINRLTWAVIDGRASLTDRRRLAELVHSQHATRPREAGD